MININKTDNFLKQQIECLEILTELIAFDKEHGSPAENTKVLEAFIETQKRALNMANKLLEKHKPMLEAEEKAEDKKAQIIKDLKTAQTDENSLFACTLDESQNQADEDKKIIDEYSFEEID